MPRYATAAVHVYVCAYWIAELKILLKIVKAYSLYPLSALKADYNISYRKSPRARGRNIFEPCFFILNHHLRCAASDCNYTFSQKQVLHEFWPRKKLAATQIRFHFWPKKSNNIYDVFAANPA